MGIVTKKIDTNGKWVNVGEELGITMTDNTLHSVQIHGIAKISYSSSADITGYFVQNDPKVFTYEKLSGEDFYINGNNLLVSMSE